MEIPIKVDVGEGRGILLLFINELLQVRKFSSKPKCLGCFWIF